MAAAPVSKIDEYLVKSRDPVQAAVETWLCSGANILRAIDAARQRRLVALASWHGRRRDAIALRFLPSGAISFDANHPADPRRGRA
jgi:hypothetical protein